NVFIVYPYGTIKESELKENEFIGIRPQEINRFIVAPKKHWERYVILQPVSFRQNDFQLHKQLRAIDNNILISQLSAEQIGKETEIFVSKAELLRDYCPVTKLIEITIRLLVDCSFDFDFKTTKNRKTFTGNRYDYKQLLYKYTMDGFIKRYGA